jgi:protein associated with RNAse G/E
MPGELVQVVYRKYDGALHWNYWTRLLGEDRYGIWLGAPGGTTLRRGDQVVEPSQTPHVLLMPRDQWWSAAFNAPPHRTEIYCDINTVPAWPTPYEVTMIDLDLDVRRRRTGLVEILDEDEFAEHRVRYGYPPDVVSAAEHSAAHLAEVIAANEEPFGSVYQSWLAQLMTPERPSPSPAV